MKSMTGYGTAEGSVGKGLVFIEIKSVNHRFCEISVKNPPKMGVLEPKITKYLENKYMRGKFDVFIKEIGSLFGGVEINVDVELAKRYQKALKALSKELKEPVGNNILQYIDVDRFVTLREKIGNYEQFWIQIKKLLGIACKQVDKMRMQEGAFIKNDQKKRIEKIQKLISKIRAGAKHSLVKNEDRVRKKMNGVGQLDEQRLITEVALIGGRQDITEEVVRLESHIKQYNTLLASKGSVGRKLDFLLQEVNREINTIGSKASDATISRLVVECKSELERLREQVQNIE